MVILYWCAIAWGLFALALAAYLYFLEQQGLRQSKNSVLVFIQVFFIVSIRLPLHFLFAYGRAIIQLIGTCFGFYRDEESR